MFLYLTVQHVRQEAQGQYVMSCWAHFTKHPKHLFIYQVYFLSSTVKLISSSLFKKVAGKNQMPQGPWMHQQGLCFITRWLHNFDSKTLQITHTSIICYRLCRWIFILCWTELKPVERRKLIYNRIICFTKCS